MTDDKGFTHPYVPNAAPEARRYLLKAIGVESADDLYASVPQELQVQGLLNLPEPMPSEHDLRKHVEAIIGQNESCRDHLNFCGAGCWQHYVPALCDEITGRGEFLTAYGGGTYYTEIYGANRGQILDPNIIFPGQILTLPVLN